MKDYGEPVGTWCPICKDERSSRDHHTECGRMHRWIWRFDPIPEGQRPEAEEPTFHKIRRNRPDDGMVDTLRGPGNLRQTTQMTDSGNVIGWSLSCASLHGRVWVGTAGSEADAVLWVAEGRLPGGEP